MSDTKRNYIKDVGEKRIMEKTWRKTTANWSIELNVECPYCNHYFDVMNDYGEQEMFNTAQVGESKKFEPDRFEVNCPECKKEFIINEVAY